MTAIKKRKYNETGLIDSKEDILKCLSCPKPECTNCVGYNKRTEARRRRGESV